MNNEISILIPCLNEERYIADCLQSILSFEIPNRVDFEVILLDGGSTDKTLNIVSEFIKKDSRFKLLNNPGKIQSKGLNIGVQVAKGEWVMRLDAHTTYPSNYLKLCYETAKCTGSDNVGGICITNPGGKGYQAQIVQALTTHKFGVGNSGFRIGAQAGPRDTVPFGFFRRDVFDNVGFFDERLVRTQDFEFNRRIKVSKGTIFLNPKITSTYFNVSKVLPFLEKQLFKQGPYNVYMWTLAPYSFVPRHCITGLFAAFFWAGAFLSAFSNLAFYSFFAVMVLYFFLAVISSVQQAIRYHFIRHLFSLPFSFFLFHLCHGTGMLIGAFKVLAKISPVQKIKEPWGGAGKFRAWP